MADYCQIRTHPVNSAVMLSEAKHLCSFSLGRIARKLIEILRFAQNDTYETPCNENLARSCYRPLAGYCMAAEPTWNPADAVKEAEQDIRAGHIKFYWAGSIASRPVGVPFEVAKNYPKANAGIGCVTNDIPLRERQEEYARRYNEKIYAYVTQKH